MAKTILLIEYEPRYLDRIKGYLAGKDFDLVIAKDGEDGLEAFRRGRPDLVLISTVLPKLRTRDVIRGMQALGPTPPVLLMASGYKGKDKKADAAREGASGILEKPFAEEALLAEISYALGAKTPDPFPGAGSQPLLSADDIFSDVISGVEAEDRLDKQEKARTAPAPAPAGTDPGINRKLEQTLSGILSRPSLKTPAASAPKASAETPVPSRPAPPAEPVSDRTQRVDSGSLPIPAPKPKPDTAVDRMLTDTLSGLRPIKPVEKVDKSEKPAAVPAPAPKPAPAPSPAPKPEPLPAPKPAPAAAAAPKARPAAGSPGGFGRYQLLEKIAAGGMAEVYRARMRGEEGFEKIVAIKRILPHMADNDDFITMFIDEAKLAAQLTHNNIIHIYDLGKEDAYHYIAMEYVEGKDLRSILKTATEKGYPLPVDLALLIASKVANALDYAHRRLGLDGKELNLVHRDVSPQNVLISFEGDIKLCDFGIAKAATKVQQTQAGALKGKLQYMSPEQAWGKKVDRRTDIFSLGIVLFEMLTGERLFSGDTDLTILEQVRDARSEAPSLKNPDVPKKVDQIVLKALAKNPQDRYQNASEMEKDLNSVLYSFQPAPGAADLAIFMHRLVEASAAASDAQIDAAFAQVAAAPAPEEKKKGKGLVISKKEKAVEPAPVPEPVEVSQPAISIGEEPSKSRTGLFAGIVVGLVVLGAAAYFMTRGKAPEAAAPVPVPAAAPATTEAAPPATGAPAVPEKVIDPKALEAELRKMTAEEAKKLRDAAQKAAADQAKPVAPSTAPAAAPAVSLAPGQPLQPPKATPEPTRAPEPTKAAEPTPVPPRPTTPPVAVEAPRAAAPAPAVPAPAAVVREGDTVGPGPGVVEPQITKLGRFSGLPAQAAQMQRRNDPAGLGTVTIMALVTETGQVTDTRVVRASGNKFVDDAAVAALKGSQIQPATKGGVKVKMWKTFAITVKP
ncbi:MAG: TonB family protein [Holophagales bacterium]|nr:TonB family protein [Holophagales bacterium]